MRKLIFGCGYLGLRVARRWIAQGNQVDAITRSLERAVELKNEGLCPVVDDVNRPTKLPPLDTYQTVLYAIGYDRLSTQPVPSMRDVYVMGLRNVLQLASRIGSLPERFIYVSSTGVFGNTGGPKIDERTECQPQREGGRVCLEAEGELKSSPMHERSIVLRMAGIYGPGRVPRKQELLAGKPLHVPDTGTLNLIHVDDAAEVVLAAERFATLPSLYLVSDGAPVERTEYFRAMAEILGVPPPQFQPPADDAPVTTRARSDKRIDNSRMLRELHVELRYPSYREGLAGIIAAGG